MEFVNGKDDIPYIMKWNIKFMFETTTRWHFNIWVHPFFMTGWRWLTFIMSSQMVKSLDDDFVEWPQSKVRIKHKHEEKS